MRKNRGECVLASLAGCGCLVMALVVCGIAGYFYYLRASRPQYRPMAHRTPTKTVNQHGESVVSVRRPGPEELASAWPTPLPEESWPGETAASPPEGTPPQPSQQPQPGPASLHPVGSGASKPGPAENLPETKPGPSSPVGLQPRPGPESRPVGFQPKPGASKPGPAGNRPTRPGPSNPVGLQPKPGPEFRPAGSQPKPGVNPVGASPTPARVPPVLPVDVPGWKVSAGGLELYATRAVVEQHLGPLVPVKDSKNPWRAYEFTPKRGGTQHLFFSRDGLLVAVTDAPSLECQGETLQPGQAADLAHLRQLIPTHRENQKFDVTGPVRHAFPLNGVQVQIWILDHKIQRLALCPADIRHP